jgi:hypothetical protein
VRQPLRCRGMFKFPTGPVEETVFASEPN